MPDVIKQYLRAHYSQNKYSYSDLIPLSHLFAFVFVYKRWLAIEDDPVEALTQIHKKLES